MKKLTIKDLSPEDRPREKLRDKGVASLSDAELIAILIRSGSGAETAVQLSQRILHSAAGNLTTLSKYSIEELTHTFKGIGEAKAISIIAALELGRRRNDIKGGESEFIMCSYDSYKMFYSLIVDLPYEELWMIHLNQANKILNKVKVSQGGIGKTIADFRLILKSAINSLATGIVLCHNHPSGSKQPSREDDLLTEKLKEAAKLVNIQLLDHLIIAGDSYYSYADEGRIL